MTSIGEVKTKLINMIDGDIAKAIADDLADNIAAGVANLRQRIVGDLGALEAEQTADKVAFKKQLQAQALREETARVDASVAKLLVDRAENDARRSVAEAKKAIADADKTKAEADKRIAAANAMRAEAEAVKAKAMA